MPRVLLTERIIPDANDGIIISASSSRASESKRKKGRRARNGRSASLSGTRAGEARARYLAHARMNIQIDAGVI